jgi:hypothetical protein
VVVNADRLLTALDWDVLELQNGLRGLALDNFLKPFLDAAKMDGRQNDAPACVVDSRNFARHRIMIAGHGRLTGNYQVPTLALDDGTLVDGRDTIIAWAKAHPRRRVAP